MSTKKKVWASLSLTGSRNMTQGLVHHRYTALGAQGTVWALGAPGAYHVGVPE